MTEEMNEEIRLNIDKFIFRFPKALLYSEEGLWIHQANGLLRIGLSDFSQQRNGDVAFAVVSPAGTVLDAGDEIASIETIKVLFSLPSPAKGMVVETNSSLQDSPELINQDPYGEGWIAVLSPENFDRDRAGLMTAEKYSDLARQQAEAELKA